MSENNKAKILIQSTKIKKINGKIILVDDDSYEKEALILALEKRNWQVKVEYFSDVKTALEHLRNDNEEIFLIISDMNMPKMNGMDFKKAIDDDPVLTKKSIPFIFASSVATKAEITQAYNYRVQGYFGKPNNIEDQAEMLDLIIKYWIVSRHPNKDDI